MKNGPVVCITSEVQSPSDRILIIIGLFLQLLQVSQFEQFFQSKVR